ncbi:fluoride efflux transporter CrcB [Ruegeria marina]|uniref:Fluoride-specific ion channel FluC n=1 Tax=Ruegeria marina TaxID=639004 RepID=A0A1G6UFJ0_9RHOB|nr:fluoride efflux transporter CrcB [Ruegeria marina]SDD40029.1 camphor resistance protein CrcB [Ruegeria marina]
MSGLYLHLLFALGGGLGAVLRHWTARRITHDLPLATLAVNVAGTLLLGLWLGHLDAVGAAVSEDARRLVFGFCGGLTTFSSFAYQTLDLHRSRTILTAAGNILASVALCVAAFLLGQKLAG